MKKFLLTLSLIFIISIVSIPVFATGNFVDSIYGYSVSFQSVTGNTAILQSVNPAFLSTDKRISVIGDYRITVLNGTSLSTTDSTAISYISNWQYINILNSSYDLYNYQTKQLIYQSGQKDIIGLTQEQFDSLYYMFGVLFGGIISVVFSTSFKMGV